MPTIAPRSIHDNSVKSVHMSDSAPTPAPDVLHPGVAGYLRYRPAFTSVRVDPSKNGGRRLTVNDDGRIVTFDLSAEQAEFLARLLSSAAGA